MKLPIKIDSTSNGEFVPRPLEPINIVANESARTALAKAARRTGMPRRTFVQTAAAVATTLAAFNKVNAAAGRDGGFFAVSQDAPLEPALAQTEIGGNEFIFDVQGHYVVPPSLAQTLKPRCGEQHAVLDRDYMRCIGADNFIKDIFFDSDTDVMVLSFIPSRRDDEPLTVAEAAATRELVEQLQGTRRLMIHGRVNPNQAGDVEAMAELSDRWQVCAWKCYTQWGPDGRGFYLFEDAGLAMIERARALGIKTICVHKGIPFGRRSYEHSTCVDIGVVARQYPDVNFLVYHAGYVPGAPEGPYRPGRGDGVDELIASVERAGLGQHSNVYAELGSTWRMLMRNPEEAAHCVGKLLKHLGPRNVLYGSDCVWYGSPQDQIQALRAFRIAPEFQERFGYPELDAAQRAALLGLNAARVYGIDPQAHRSISGDDAFSAAREAYRGEPAAHFETYGPRTRREFLQLWRQHGRQRT